MTQDQSARPSEARVFRLVPMQAPTVSSDFDCLELMGIDEEEIVYTKCVGGFHVIEKSAYDQLAAQLTEANRRLAIAREGLEAIRWSWENDAGRQCDNIAFETLEKL